MEYSEFFRVRNKDGELDLIIISYCFDNDTVTILKEGGDHITEEELDNISTISFNTGAYYDKLPIIYFGENVFKKIIVDAYNKKNNKAYRDNVIRDTYVFYDDCDCSSDGCSGGGCGSGGCGCK